MAEKKFLMLSLEEKETKKVANVISNDSARKILDYLATKEATESELSEKLSVPISTIHYNLSQLVETGLVLADEFHYSKKGKEVLHYKLANKYIIIAPKEVSGLREKLSKLLPVALLSAGAAGIAQLLSSYFSHPFLGDGFYAAPVAMESSVMMAKGASAPVMDTAYSAPSALSSLSFDVALWFFSGAMIGALLYLGISSIRKK